MANIKVLAIYGLLLSAQVSPGAICAEYMLMPSPATVHIGNFNAALKPVLTIDCHNRNCMYSRSSRS